MEREHSLALKARQRTRFVLQRLKAVASQIWPTDFWSWLRLLVSYGSACATVGAVILLLLPSLATQGLAGLFGTQSPTVTTSSEGLPWAHQGDVEVKVTSARMGRGVLHYPGGIQLAESHVVLAIQLAITNHSTSKPVDYTTWRGREESLRRDFATLIDNRGNPYLRITFGKQVPEGGVGQVQVAPGQTIHDLLVLANFRRESLSCTFATILKLDY